MSNPQPTIQHLTHRLARCPREFLEEPRQGKRPGIHVDAVVADLLMEIGGTSHPPLRFARFEQPGPGQRNHMRLVLVAAWLLYDPCFRNRPHFVSPLSQWLTVDLERLSELVDAHAFVDDAGRREALRPCRQAGRGAGVAVQSSDLPASRQGQLPPFKTSQIQSMGAH